MWHHQLGEFETHGQIDYINSVDRHIARAELYADQVVLSQQTIADAAEADAIWNRAFHEEMDRLTKMYCCREQGYQAAENTSLTEVRSTCKQFVEGDD